MEYCPLSLEHQHPYRQLLSVTPEKSSDYSFVTLWGWHSYAGYEMGFGHGLAWLKINREGKVFRGCPVGDWSKVDWERVIPEEFPEGAVFERVPSGLASLLERTFPGRVELEPQRAEWEYVYSVKDLVELQGNRYHKKKNLLRQFLRNQGWVFEPMVQETIPEVLAMQAEWCAWKDCSGSESLAAENEAVKRVLGSWDRLEGVLGGIIRVDGAIVAYTVAERFSTDTLVIHFEKGNQAFKGVYQAINQVFLEQEGEGFAWVNRQQDAGEPGMRQAKLSYHPNRFVEKFRVRISV